MTPENFADGDSEVSDIKIKDKSLFKEFIHAIASNNATRYSRGQEAQGELEILLRELPAA